MDREPEPWQTNAAGPSENKSIIEAAAVEIKARSPLELHISAPESWREIDVHYPAGQVLVRLTPAGEDATDVEVFSFGNLLIGERVGGYRSPARLAKLVDGIYRRAIER
jgi:hypothetical protein